MATIWAAIAIDDDANKSTADKDKLNRFRDGVWQQWPLPSSQFLLFSSSYDVAFFVSEVAVVGFAVLSLLFLQVAVSLLDDFTISFSFWPEFWKMSSVSVGFPSVSSIPL